MAKLKKPIVETFTKMYEDYPIKPPKYFLGFMTDNQLTEEVDVFTERMNNIEDLIDITYMDYISYRLYHSELKWRGYHSIVASLEGKTYI